MGFFSTYFNIFNVVRIRFTYLAFPLSPPLLRTRCWPKRRSLKTGTCLWEVRPPTTERTSLRTMTSSELSVQLLTCVCVRRVREHLCLRGQNHRLLHLLSPPQPPLHPFPRNSGTVCWIVNRHCRYQTGGGTSFSPTTNTKGPSRFFFLSTVLFLTFRSKARPGGLAFHRWCLPAASPASLPQRSV